MPSTMAMEAMLYGWRCKLTLEPPAKEANFVFSIGKSNRLRLLNPQVIF